MGDGDEDDDVPSKGKQTLASKQKKQLEKLMAHPVRSRNRSSRVMTDSAGEISGN